MKSQTATVSFAASRKRQHRMSASALTAEVWACHLLGMCHNLLCHLADGVVDRSANMLTTAWKNVARYPFPAGMDGAVPMTPYLSTAEHMPVKQFVHEIIRRSGTKFVTLRYALEYTETVADMLPLIITAEAKYALQRRAGCNGDLSCGPTHTC